MGQVFLCLIFGFKDYFLSLAPQTKNVSVRKTYKTELWK